MSCDVSPRLTFSSVAQSASLSSHSTPLSSASGSGPGGPSQCWTLLLPAGRDTDSSKEFMANKSFSHKEWHLKRIFYSNNVRETWKYFGNLTKQHTTLLIISFPCCKIVPEAAGTCGPSYVTQWEQSIWSCNASMQHQHHLMVIDWCWSLQGLHWSPLRWPPACPEVVYSRNLLAWGHSSHPEKGGEPTLGRWRSWKNVTVKMTVVTMLPISPSVHVSTLSYMMQVTCMVTSSGSDWK